MKTKAYLFLLFLCLVLVLPCSKVSAAEDPFHLNETQLKLQVGNHYQLYLMNSNQSDDFYYFNYYPCNWTSSNETVATVSDGYVQIVGKGKATITAVYNGKKYNCAITAVASSYHLTKSDIQTKTFSKEYVRMTNTDDVSYYSYDVYRIEDQTEILCSSYSVFDIDIDSDTGKIFLTAKQSGNFRIDFYANVEDDETCFTQTYKASCNVSVKAHGLIERELGCALSTRRQLTFGDLSNITFQVENPELASVNEQGIITPLSIGETYVTMSGYNELNELEQYSCDLYITNPKVTLDKNYVKVNENVPLNIEGYSWCDNIIYKSSNEKVISTNGYEHFAQKVGKATIAVIVDGRKFTFKVEVVDPQLKKDEFLLSPSESAQITLVGLNQTLKEEPVSYSVGNSKIATVSNTGKITAKACGNTILTVKFADYTLKAGISIGNKKSIQAIKNASGAFGSTYSQEKRMQKGYYDCSSLIWRSYAPTGINFGDSFYAPTAANIAKYLYDHKKVISDTFIDPKKLQPGDLIFYGGENNGRFRNIYHVSMFTGISPDDYYSYGDGSYYPYSGRIIHASKGTVRTDYLSEGYGTIVMIARPTK